MTLSAQPVQADRTCIPDVVICGVFLEDLPDGYYDVVVVSESLLVFGTFTITFDDVITQPSVEIPVIIEPSETGEFCKVWVNFGALCYFESILGLVEAVDGTVCFHQTRVGFSLSQEGGTAVTVPVLCGLN